MLKKITTTCQVNVNGQIKTMTFFLPGTFVEISNASTKLVPDKLTEDEILNGIQYRVWVVLGGTSFRLAIGPEWGEWRHLEPFDEKYFRTVGDRYKSTTIEAAKRSDKWTFRASRLGQPFDPDVIASNKPSCEVLTSDNPKGK